MAEKDFMKPAEPAALSVTDRIKQAFGFGNKDTGSAGLPIPSNGSVGLPSNLPNSLRGSNDDKPGPMAFNKNNNPSASEEYKIDFQPNVFDKFDTYTYHWKFFITSLYNAYQGTVLSPANQTIIAETGITDLSLDKVEINGIAVPSVMAGTGTQTTLKFQITEPSGAGLLDKMYHESIALGIGNWLVMPCFMQLEFRGRAENTAEALDGAPGDLKGLKWVWPIKLTNMKAHVTHVGTRYDCDAIVYDELAQSNSYFAIQHNIVLEELDKFQDAINQLEAKINEDQINKIMGRYSFPDIYKFVVDPIIAENAKITVPDKNQNTSRWSSYAKFTDKQVSYNPGTGIDKIVDSLLGNTDYFQRKLQSSETRTSEPESANNAESMRTLWRIVTETHPYTYDPMRQDNAVEITIYITEYDLGLLEATPPQTGQTPETLPASKKRMSTYFSKKILNKRYDYIFTGLNDQIIKFDLNMNFSFAAALSRFGGIYYDTAGKDMGVVAQDKAGTERRVATYLSEQLKLINSADFKEDRVAAAEALKIRTGTAAAVSKETADRNAALIDKFKNGRLKVDQIKEDALREESRRASSSLAPANSQQLRFISDVNTTTAEVKAAAKTAEALKAGKLRPIPYRDAPQENNLAIGTEPTSDAARARTASLFSTALYSTLDASLQTIKITIKGDPYWLFPRQLDTGAKQLPFKSKMSEGDAIKVIKSIQGPHPDSVNFFGTDNFIIVRLRTPRVANDATGLIDRPNDPADEVETFSGVYKVVTVINKFEIGVFTQELFCILDPIINLQEFLQEVEAKSRKTSTKQNAEKPLPPERRPMTIQEFFQQSQADVQAQAKLLFPDKSNIPAADYKLTEAELRLQAQSKNF